MNITQNPPINPTRGGRADQMKKLEALFGGGSKPTTPVLTQARTAPTNKTNIEARFAAAFKNGPDSSSDGTSVTGNTDGINYNAALINKGPSAYKLRLERIRNATGEKELNSAIETFLTSHDLPDDISIILKVLTHPNEVYVRKGLAELVGMLTRQELMGTSLVLEALDKLASRQVAPETQSYIDGIRSMLAKTK